MANDVALNQSVYQVLKNPDELSICCVKTRSALAVTPKLGQVRVLIVQDLAVRDGVFAHGFDSALRIPGDIKHKVVVEMCASSDCFYYVSYVISSKSSVRCLGKHFQHIAYIDKKAVHLILHGVCNILVGVYRMKL